MPKIVIILIAIISVSVIIILPISFGFSGNTTINETPHLNGGTKNDYDVLIVGAGFSGAVVADILATKGFKVLVIDKRDHIAGNCYDVVDNYGILIHKYGPHMFHTNDEEVWNYISNKASFRPYVHFVESYVNNTPVPFPVNRVTLNMLFNLDLKTEEDVDNFLKEETAEYQNIEVSNSEELILKTFGRRIYSLLYENYNKKMWKMPASKLAASVSARIPWRKNDINRYFDDRFQALPKKSFTDVIQHLLHNERITVLLNTPMEKLNPLITFKKVYYTGLIDGLCDFSLGTLPYLSVDIKFETIESDLLYLPAPVCNYPNDNTYHRVFEAKWINPSFSKYTTLSYETSKLEGEPYYAIPNTTNIEMYQKYRNTLNNLKRVVIFGRLGDYKYYNMDAAIKRALEIGRTTYSDINSFTPINIKTFLNEVKNTCNKPSN